MVLKTHNRYFLDKKYALIAQAQAEPHANPINSQLIS